MTCGHSVQQVEGTNSCRQQQPEQLLREILTAHKGPEEESSLSLCSRSKVVLSDLFPLRWCLQLCDVLCRKS